MDTTDKARQWCEGHKGPAWRTYDVWDGEPPHATLHKLCGRCVVRLRRAGYIVGHRVESFTDIPFRTVVDRMPPASKTGKAAPCGNAQWYTLVDPSDALILALQLRGFLVERETGGL